MPYFIKRKENLLDPEEVLLDKKAKESAEKEKLDSLQWPLSKTLMKIIFWLAVILSIVVFLRCFYLTILKGADFEVRALNNKNRYFYIEAPRGIIYDRNKNPLVVNSPSYSLMMIPMDLPTDSEELKNIVEIISQIFGIKTEEMQKLLDYVQKYNLIYSFEPILVKTDVKIDQIRSFESKIGDEKGFVILPAYEREYPYGEVFSHVLGYVGKISSDELEKYKDYPLSSVVGKTGLESFYEETLKGIPGRKNIEIDATLNVKKSLDEIAPQAGSNIITTLDKDLQEFFYKTLKKSVEDYSAKGAAGIILNPKNGEILSLVSLDSFDPNVMVKGKDTDLINEYLFSKRYVLFNRVVSGIYQPGSLIKPLMALAALEENIIDPDKKIYDEGQIVITSPYNPEEKYIYRDWEQHGWVDMKKAISRSCNVYFWTIGGGYQDINGLGWEKIKKYWLKFGFGEKTGLDLEGEAQDILPDPEYLKQVRPNDPTWRLGDTYNVSIGEGGLSLTPLKMSTYISLIANNGILFQPHLVKAVETQDNFQEIQLVISRKLDVSQENLKIVQEGMREVVLSGTATSLRSALLEIAGKSGSPKYGSGSEERYNAIFGAYAPYEDPEIVILIVVENPTSNTGSTLPVIKDVINWYATNRYQQEKEGLNVDE